MNQKARNRLYNFHKSLYEEAIQEANTHTPLGSPSVIEYSKEFYRSLPKTHKRTNIESLVKKIKDYQVILYGDFHTHRQTQKGLLRILEEYIQNDPSRSVVLFMEMFRAIDQKHINDFFDNKIDEAALLKNCKYAENWGFPWENYRLLIDFAKAEGIQVLGINTNDAGKDRLPKRDLFASRIINQVSEEFPEALCVCLIGEYHLADAHLPAFIDNNISTMRILTNIDEFYFNRENYDEYAKTEYLNLKPDLYCVLNSPPWIKWRSYSMWEEKKSTEYLHDSEVLYTEESYDIDYQIVSIIGHLTEFLEISLNNSEMSDFHSYWNLSPQAFKELKSHESISSYTKAILSHRLEIDGFFYIPETKFALLKKHTLNSLAELSGQILYCKLQGKLNFNKPMDYFIHRTLMISAGVLASRALNPRRKFPDIHHFEADLQRLYRKKLKEGDRIYRQALRYSIRLYYRLKSGRNRLDTSLIEKDITSKGIFSLILGQILGGDIYYAIMDAKKPTIKNSDTFRLSIIKNDIRQQYQSLIDLIS